MGVIWNGNVTKLANLIVHGRHWRTLHAYGISIGWVFIGLVLTRKEQSDGQPFTR